MEFLKKNVKLLKNITYKKIMLRLINIYEEECCFNEGSLMFNDLITIYNLFHCLEEEEIC